MRTDDVLKNLPDGEQQRGRGQIDCSIGQQRGVGEIRFGLGSGKHDT